MSVTTHANERLDRAALLQTALGDGPKQKRIDAVDTLAAVEHPDVPALIAIVREAHNDDISVRALEMLARVGKADADDELLRVLSRDSNARRVRSAARYLARYRFAENVRPLVAVLSGPKPLEVKSAVAAELVDRVELPQLESYRKELARALVTAGDASLGVMLARLFARQWTGDDRLAAVLDALLPSTTISRDNLDGKTLSLALQPQDAEDRRKMVDRLVRAGRQGDDRHAVGLVASLLIVITGGADAAGHALNEAGARLSLKDAEMQPLRLQVGGEAALTPLLKSIQDDLETYFRRPLHKLRDDTEANWQRTMRSAEHAFTVRVVMSILVFAVGLGLVVASAIALLTGASGDPILGEGVSLFAGVGTMLLVVYTGPLKDIKASATDLGSANAAFIAYVHRVSEISHTFSAKYLREEVSYEDLEKSCKLLRQAAADAIKELNMSAAVAAKEER